ncbi:MAG TPA: hypothetical protein VFU31_25920 [Candidatus Binatia bacterium]|nr:hypothetical protein [Candidatus Binatia bacterium]
MASVHIYGRTTSAWLTGCRGILALVLLVTMCGPVAQSDEDSYPPTATSRFIIGKVTHWERGPKIEHPVSAKIALAVGGVALTLGFQQSFVRFDRNRNRRLWPVVALNSTRSPPSNYAVRQS